MAFEICVIFQSCLKNYFYVTITDNWSDLLIYWIKIQLQMFDLYTNCHEILK